MSATPDERSDGQSPEPPRGEVEASSTPIEPQAPAPLPIRAFELRVPADPAKSRAAAAKVDRWAHRRAEPRALAFVWMLFLIGASLLTVGAQGVFGLIAPDVYRPGARLFLCVLGVGVSIVWPMIRLSQYAPARPVRSTLLDALVVLGPTHAVIWPQALPWMAAWPLRACATLAAIFTAWGMLVAALLMVAYGTRARDRDYPAPSVPRGVWMIVFVVLAFASPLAGLPSAFSSPPTDPWDVWAWALFSPITAAFEVARDRSWTGSAVAPMAEHAAAAWVILAIGAGALGWAAFRRGPAVAARLD